MVTFLLLTALVGIILGGICLVQQLWVPMSFIGSPPEVMEAMLAMASLQPHQRVVDLGAGDGRMLRAAKTREPSIKAIGYEAAVLPWLLSLWRCRGSGIRLRLGSAYHAPLRDADMIFIYVWPSFMKTIAPRLESLKNGARVIAHSFALPGHTPLEEQRIEVHGKIHTIRLYRF